MKINKLLLLASTSALMISASSAATYTFTNNSGPVNTLSITNRLGGFLNTGSVAIGSYLGGAPTITADSTMGQILSGFTTLVSTTMGTSGTDPNTINGVFNVQTSGADPLDNLSSQDAAAWLGKNFYVIIGNSSVLSESTEALVFVFSNSTIGGTEPVTSTLNMRSNATTANGTLLFGTFNTVQIDPTPGTPGNANAAFALQQIVPEPSAALLGLLGAIGLIRRRR
jgi:hypothetical protein